MHVQAVLGTMQTYCNEQIKIIDKSYGGSQGQGNNGVTGQGQTNSIDSSKVKNDKDDVRREWWRLKKIRNCLLVLVEIIFFEEREFW